MCTCQGCFKPYRVDLLVPDEVWERIKPEGKPVGAGLLCPECIGRRVEALGEHRVLMTSSHRGLSKCEITQVAELVSERIKAYTSLLTPTVLKRVITTGIHKALKERNLLNHE